MPHSHHSRSNRSILGRQNLRLPFATLLSLLTLLTLGVLGLTGCFTNTDPNYPPAHEVDPPGMRMMRAKGKSVRMGAIGELAASNEAPRLTAHFSYDFWMDTVEVTQSRFRNLLGRNPVPPGSAGGFGDDHPVFQVTWYDAVLYCNAMGKQAGLDTVYAYDRVLSGPEGGVYGMEGLSIHLERKGYRLPTEAEWEFAARAGSTSDFPWGGSGDSALSDQFSWYAGNALNASHPVASLKPNAFGLYDMAGNVMEWVGDWKGPFPSTDATDFAGARDPSPEADIPVKGGAFNFGRRELRPANRSATYATIRSAAADYVGFRCALGTIAHPWYASADGGRIATDPVTLTVTRPQRLVGGRPVKLVFINASADLRHLAYVDYGPSPPVLTEFTDIPVVFHPSISPDGNWAAFCTRAEGADTGSTLYIRALGGTGSREAVAIGPGFIPRWWVDPLRGDTALIYASSALDNLSPRWHATKTLLRRIHGGLPAGEPEVLTSNGGFHDGRSQDGRYLATGYRELLQRDLLTGRTRILFTGPLNGKAADDTSQVCNVSTAPDSSGRTLFLDFGSPDASTLTGYPYDIHQVAFVSDTSGQVVRWYHAPGKDASWDDLEWSNHPDYAVSALKNAAGRHAELGLLNLRDSVVTVLAQGTSLDQPCLWVGGSGGSGNSEGLNPDSLGHYNDPETGSSQAVFSDKLSRFWKVHDGLELVSLGSSHVDHGITPGLFTRYKAFNLGYSAAGLDGMLALGEHYVLPHCPKLKVVILEAYLTPMYVPGGDWGWGPLLSRSKGFQYDLSHGFWVDGLPDRFQGMMEQAPNARFAAIDSMGNHPLQANGWGGKTAAGLALGNDWTVSDPNYQKNFERIRAFAKQVSDRGIHLVLVLFPQNPEFANSKYFQFYGPPQATARAAIASFQNLEKTSDHIHFYDAHRYGQHDYTDEDAFDVDHLAEKGAIKLTRRLDSLIATFKP